MIRHARGGLRHVAKPPREGVVQVRQRRQISYAEFGHPDGRVFFWMHGTPGSRRQVPFDARRYADEHGLRIIGIDRPGIGSSTTHLYPNILDWTRDLEILLEELDVDDFSMVGLSGGGPYTLAAGVAFPDRVTALGVLGGVPPVVGPDAMPGGLMSLAPIAAPALQRLRVPLGVGLGRLIQLIRPLAGVAIAGYAAVQPDGDKSLLREPAFKDMFIDDLLNGTLSQFGAPLNDIVLFTRDWGFTAADVTVPVFWWHGDCDSIIAYEQGAQMAARLPNAVFTTVPGQAHLGGLGIATEVLQTLVAVEKS